MTRQTRRCHIAAIQRLSRGMRARKCTLERDHEGDHQDDYGLWKIEDIHSRNFPK